MKFVAEDSRNFRHGFQNDADHRNQHRQNNEQVDVTMQRPRRRRRVQKRENLLPERAPFVLLHEKAHGVSQCADDIELLKDQIHGFIE